MRILILGGTGFTGPYQVKYALSRGHKVTTFNRGKTHPGELPAEVEQLVGDRNGNLDALVASAEKARMLMPKLRDAVLPESKQEPPTEYVLIRR